MLFNNVLGPPNTEIQSMTVESCLLNFPWSLMANTMFLIGAIMWIVSAALCESAESTGDWVGCESSAITATTCFLVDAMLYFGAWWSMKRMERDNPFGRHHLAKQTTGWRATLQSFDYLFWGNLMFFVGTGLDYLTSYLYYSTTDLELQSYGNLTYFISMLLWMVYAGIEIVRSWLNIANRHTLQAPIAISFHVTANPNKLRKLGYSANVRATVFPWDLLGAILFELASMFYMLAALVCWPALSGNDGEFSCLPFEMTGAVLFVFNAVVLFFDDAVAASFRNDGIFDLCVVDQEQFAATQLILETSPPQVLLASDAGDMASDPTMVELENDVSSGDEVHCKKDS